MANNSQGSSADKIHVAAFDRKIDVRPLSELPNREGFKFRGIPKKGGRYMNCRLKSLPGCGVYIVDQGGYVYDDASDKLAGWVPHPSKRLSSSHSEVNK